MCAAIRMCRLRRPACISRKKRIRRSSIPSAGRWSGSTTRTSQGHITSACGLGIYRDVLLGPEFYGNAFIGEVAHNLVRRYRLDPQGATFDSPPARTTKLAWSSSPPPTTGRAPCRFAPGRDGALYIVDMYRAVIEHTRWIPADRLAKIDPRAGDTMGRIYRLFPTGKKLRPVQDLTKLDAAALVAALDTPNGTTRDLVHQLLLQKNDPATRELSVEAGDNEQAACGAGAGAVGARWQWDVVTAILLQALRDPDARVRRLRCECANRGSRPRRNWRMRA